MSGFKHVQSAPISLEDLEREYCRLTTQPYPIEEMVFARSWMLFRVCLLTCRLLSDVDLLREIACCDCARHRSAICKTPGELGKGAPIRSPLPAYRRPGVACCTGR